jgi:hypothetical protein
MERLGAAEPSMAMTALAVDAHSKDRQLLGWLGIFLSLFIKNMIYSCQQWAPHVRIALRHSTAARPAASGSVATACVAQAEYNLPGVS